VLELSSGVLNLGPDQEMKENEANPLYLEYRVQPGIVDLDHLELVALKRVGKSSWMPHFRLIPPTQSPLRLPPKASPHTQEHVKPPERRLKVNRGDTRKGSKAHRQSFAPAPAHSEVAAGVPQSPKMPLGFWGRFITKIRKALTKTRRGR